MLRAHRLAREGKVLERLSAPATLDALTPAVYDDVPTDRHPWARLTLEAHLIKLGAKGKPRQRTVSGGASREGAPLRVSLHAVSVRRGKQVGAPGYLARARGAAERWALVGENGAGKTQLLKLLAGRCLADPHRPRSTASTARAAAKSDLIEAKRRIAYLGGELQDKYARYGWNLSVRDLVATGLAPHGSAARAGHARPSAGRSRRRCRPAVCRARRRTILVAVVRTEAARVARARAVPGSRLAAARRALQRAGRRLPRAHRSAARGRARQRLLVDRRGASRGRCAGRHARGDRARGRAARSGACAAPRGARAT